MTPTSRLLAVLLLIALGGCTRWRIDTLPRPEAGAVWLRAARVTPIGTGRVMVLRDVRITADSVTGWYRPVDPSGLLSGPRTRVAVHRDQVVVYEQPAPDPRATAGGVALAVIVVFGGLAALYFVSHSG
jgi:hypothetical protein